MNIAVYATFSEVKEYLLNRTKDTLTVDDNILKQFTLRATKRFDTYCKRKFYPTLETQLYDHPGGIGGFFRGTNIDRGTLLIPRNVLPRTSNPASVLKLRDDLLELVTLTTSNGDTTIDSSDILLKRGNAYNPTPYDRIELTLDGGTTTFSFSGTPQQSNSVNAFWGFHTDWDNAFASVDTVQNSPLLVGDTALEVVDADGVDERGLSPRFRPQQLIRFGTGVAAEYAYITEASYETNILTIVRGVNGTTAAEQANTTAISVFRPMDDIVEAALILASYAYRRKDVVGSADDRTVASPTGLMILPSSLPDEVKDKIANYKRRFSRAR